jgi:hypothetical protein
MEGNVMKKKLLTLLFVLIFAIGMTGCSSDNDDSQDKKVSDEESNPADEKDQDSDAEVEDVEEEEDAEEVQEDSDDKSSSESSEISIEEQVLVDQDDFKITALSFNDDDNTFMGPEIYYRFENNTDTNVSIQMIDTSVNGVMIEPTLFADVAAGKQKEDYAILDYYELENSGIDVVASLEFKFSIINSESYDTIFESDIITLDTSAKNTYVQEYDTSGEVIYDSNDIKIVAKGLDTSDDIYGPQIKLYIENNTNEAMSIDIKDFSANDKMADVYFTCYVLPDKKAIESITFVDLEANGIDEIQNAEFYFNIYDPVTWDTIVDTDVISLSFE